MSESTVGDLLVRIGADTTGLVRALDESSRGLDKVAAKVRSQANDFAKYGAVSAAAAAAVGAKLVVSSVESARELRNQANAAKASVEQLQRGAFAARSAGIEQDKYADILKDVNDRVGDFVTTGGGAMIDFFEQIAPKVGVTAEQFRNLSGPDALQLYVSSLEKANISQQEMTFYMEAMSSDSTRLLPLLRDNGKAMQEMSSQADRLGIILSSMDISRMEAAAAQLDKIKSSAGSAIGVFSAEMSPVIVAVGEQFLSSAEAAGGIGVVSRSAADQVVESFGFIMDAAAGAGRAFEVSGKYAAGMAAFAKYEFLSLADDIYNFPVRAVNELIAAYNAVPNLPDINYEMGLSGFGQAIQAEMNLAAGAVNEATQDIHETLMRPLPSEQFKVLVGHARKAADEAGGELDRIRQSLLDSSNIESGAFGREADKDDPVAKLLERFATEEQLTRYFYEKMAQLERARADGRIATESEFLQMKSQLILEDQQNMRSLDEAMTQHSREQAEQRRQLAEWEAQARTQAMSQMWTDLGSLMNSKSRKMFEIGKAAAISETILSTYSSAQKSYDALAGIPVVGPALGTAAAAAAIASGLTRVQAIQSTSFGSKSGAGIGGSGAVNGGVTSGESGAPARTVTIQGISPDAMFSGRQLIQLINEAQEDGAKLVIQ